MKYVLFIIFLLYFSSISVYGQTFHYKRIMIISNNKKIKVNDDSHYITFNEKGCYESDVSGYAKTDGFLKFIKNKNNLHCYYGDGYWGKSHYYFSSNYSRFNIIIDNNVYVYQRIDKDCASAPARNYNKFAKDLMVTFPKSPNNININEKSSRKIHRITCSDCGGSGYCTGCNGSGKMISESIYTDGHKILSDCPVCKGTGNCGVCHGTGKL